jgi:hypothetical protein
MLAELEPMLQRRLVSFDLEARPNSILRLAVQINRQFGGIISDEMPLKAIAEVVPNANGGRPTVKLVEEYWKGINATNRQLGQISTLFHRLFSHALDIDTFGKLRKAIAEPGRIAKISGLGYRAEVFFADSFRKIPQVLQVVSRVDSGLV